MKSALKLSAIAIFALVSLAPAASAAVVIRGGFGPVWVGGGPVYAYPYPYAYGYAYPYPYAYGPYAPPVSYVGKLKIEKVSSGESIYVDGGYVGLTGKVRSLPLSPGNHNIEIRTSYGDTVYQQSVNIIAGRTTEIQPNI